MQLHPAACVLAAAAVLVSALGARMTEAIEFRQVGGQVYATGPWPSQVQFDADLLRVAPTFAVSPSGMVAIRVANGSAVYRLAQAGRYQRVMTMDFVAGNWTPPPSGG